MSINKHISGFTLVEILIVMALLGFLSVFSLSIFQGSQRRARDATRKNDLKEIAKTLELYAYDTKGYPPSASTGEIMGCRSGGTELVACLWGKPWTNGATTYIQKLPGDPVGGSPYCYQLDEFGKWYKLYARLEMTDDADYDDTLVCGGVSNRYNYVLLSPNITPTPVP